MGEAIRAVLTDQGRLSALSAEAPAVAAAWSPESSLAALAAAVSHAVTAPPRR
ncbi:hypothetical protein [Microbacterium sp. Se63.02b]|uniref:hypothetical protein n=1 Tax=Microbacterium sp. Se63.02b TaxID=2709304 RepID=UPI001FCEFB87|nr:hypothetical protein [Microbacterium sp. Se63.02b]